MYILIEGPDGVGKGTLIENLKKYHEDTFDDPVCDFYIDPGISLKDEHKDWQEFRSFVKNHDMDGMAEMLMFYSLRAQLMSEINKSLDDNKMVIQDRGSISTFIYQGIVKGQWDRVESLEGICDFVRPDLTIMLMAPFEVLTDRLEGREGNIDKFKSNDEFRSKVYGAYATLTKAGGEIIKPFNVVEVDASGSSDDVFNTCLELINRYGRMEYGVYI